MIDWVGSPEEPSALFRQVAERMEAILHASTIYDHTTAGIVANEMMSAINAEFHFLDFEKVRDDVVKFVHRSLSSHMFAITHRWQVPGCDLGSAVTLGGLVKQFGLVPAAAFGQ